MAILGLDYVTLMTASLDKTSAFLNESLGLQVEGERRQVGWGTATRAVVFPGHYLEIQTITDPSQGVGVARERGLKLLASGGGWKSFGLRTHDIIRTWSDLDEAGLKLTPPLGQATRDSDGSYYRWWAAGQGEAFRAGRLPNLVEYETDPYRYQRVLIPQQPPGTIVGVSGVDVALPDLTKEIPSYSTLLGGTPRLSNDEETLAHTAQWDLPDGRYVRLLSPNNGEGPLAQHLRRYGQGLYTVTFASSDMEITRANLNRRGVRIISSTPKEVLIFAEPSLKAGIKLRDEHSK